MLLIWYLRNLIYIVITFVRLIERKITNGFVICFMGLANSLCVRTLFIMLITLFSDRIKPGAWLAISIMPNMYYSVTIPFFAISTLIFGGFLRVDGMNTWFKTLFFLDNE